MLFLTFILALAATSVRSECVKVWSGDPSGSAPFPIADVVLTPGISAWKIKYQPRCVNAVLEVSACDDVKPVISISSMSESLVQRSGSLVTSLIVHGQYWCKPDSQGLPVTGDPVATPVGMSWSWK